MNQASSRSHCIFTIYIEARKVSERGTHIHIHTHHCIFTIYIDARKVSSCGLAMCTANAQPPSPNLQECT